MADETIRKPLDPKLAEIRDAVAANQKLLRACDRHEFEPTSDRLFAKVRCKNCGGTTDPVNAFWYSEGLRHALGSTGPEPEGANRG